MPIIFADLFSDIVIIGVKSRQLTSLNKWWSDNVVFHERCLYDRNLHLNDAEQIIDITPWHDNNVFTIFNTLRPRQNGRHFADDIFKRIFLNANIWIPIKISLKFVHKVSINNIPPLVQVMAWRRPGDKPLSETMMINWPTHICATRPQWVKTRYDSHLTISFLFDRSRQP